MSRMSMAIGPDFRLPAKGRLAAPSRLAAFLTRIADTPAIWRERAREREALAMADSRLLSDLGLGRAEADREWSKPFWRR